MTISEDGVTRRIAYYHFSVKLNTSYRYFFFSLKQNGWNSEKYWAFLILIQICSFLLLYFAACILYTLISCSVRMIQRLKETQWGALGIIFDKMGIPPETIKLSTYVSEKTYLRACQSCDLLCRYLAWVNCLCYSNLLFAVYVLMLISTLNLEKARHF